jgi:hypothetical protein
MGVAFAASLCSVAIGQSQAADLPVKARPAPPPVTGAFWFDAEYLYWQTKGDTLPALVTTGTTGLLGDPGTTVLFGGPTGDPWRSGGRIRAGYWFDPARKSGVEAHVFALENSSVGFFASSNGVPLLARPFFNADLGAQDAALVASPLLGPGQINIVETSKLLGAGAAYRQELCANCFGGPVTGIIGYRYLRLRDELGIATVQTITGGPAAGATIAINDQFDTTNQFHGLDLGLAGTVMRGAWTLDWRASVAVGATVTDLTIGGSTVTTVSGISTTVPGGLLALSSNSGSFSDSRLSVVPEFNARLGYRFSPQWRAYAGYNVLYWPGVVRPGGAIDTTINPALLPPGGPLTGPVRPLPRFETTDFWAHGASFGVAYNF